MGSKVRQHGFTLVELLVVIAIIGILVALLLPAIQAARESARRTQCANNIKNLALAAMNHHDVVKHFPTGGWGWSWVGDPDRGLGKEQPGGWMFNLMPFIEEGNEYKRLSDGQPDVLTQQQLLAARDLINHPLPLFGCPSRRGGARSFPKPYLGAFYANNAANGDSDVPQAGRGDYAINCGDPKLNQVKSPEGGGPATLADAATTKWCSVGTLGKTRTLNCSDEMTGVSFQRSEVGLRNITDGASKTYLIGERFLDVLAYEDGTNNGDNETWCTGYNNDNFRSTYMPPAQDIPHDASDPNATDVMFPSPYPNDAQSYEGYRIFGSSHPGGLNMSYCDGHVDTVAYTIDPYVHRSQGNRQDGGTISPANP
jgi:prepilin-type N-terminal cleavage/methylation domain-containing protein/prepilin-type processing-associated H-X9-DG protein